MTPLHRAQHIPSPTDQSTPHTHTHTYKERREKEVSFISLSLSVPPSPINIYTLTFIHNSCGTLNQFMSCFSLSAHQEELGQVYNIKSDYEKVLHYHIYFTSFDSHLCQLIFLFYFSGVSMAASQEFILT